MSLSEPTLHRLGRWLFIRRGWLPWLLLPLLLLSSRFKTPLGWSGIALACLWLAVGEAIRLWAVGYAGTRTRTRMPDGQLEDLVTAGPYAHVRNPIYVGNCAVALGIAFLFEQPLLAAPLLLLVFAAYQPVVHWEEQLLADKFGELYQRYREAVPRWLPQLRGTTPASGHRFSWQQALFSERGTIGTFLILFLLRAMAELVAMPRII
jgi:protein-S-isoprenylcysteine O-methyltransferase Ste14